MLARSIQHRSDIYQLVIALAYMRQMIQYQAAVLYIAPYIDEQRAKAYRLSRLKKTPSETDADTTHKGQRALARKYIDAAHRAGRITYWDREDGTRFILPGDPPTTGGRYAKRLPEEYTEHPSYVPNSAHIRGEV